MKLKYEDEIDDKFRKYDDRPECKTVGDVLDQLSQLPRDLPLYTGFEDYLMVGVTLMNRSELQCQISEGE